MGTRGHTNDSRTVSAARDRRGRLAIARRRVGLFAAALVVAGLAASVVAGSASAAVAGCDRVAATNGSDGAPGTAAAPFATPQKLIGSVAPGQTGCLRAGVYAWSGDLSIRTPGVRVASFPGERATLQGRLRIEATADGAVVEDLTLDGRNSNNYLSPLVYADGAVLRDNEITNHHTSICVHISAYPGAGPPIGVVIEGNRIHDCGHLPADNRDHGIYVGEARNTVIRDNWIYANADRGIQLYPDADGTLVTGNVIDGNGQGVALGGSGSQTSDNNVIENNVITNSTIRYNVESSWGPSVGSGNVVRQNCTVGGAQGADTGGIETPAKGFVASDNVVAEPQYANAAAGDFSLKASSPCLTEKQPGAVSDPKSHADRCDVVSDGTEDDDVLRGSDDGDQINGRGGDDVIDGRGGEDCLAGGSGRDKLDARDGDRDVVRCGGGRDRARVDREDRVVGCERVRGPGKSKHQD